MTQPIHFPRKQILTSCSEESGTTTLSIGESCGLGAMANGNSSTYVSRFNIQCCSSVANSSQCSLDPTRGNFPFQVNDDRDLGPAASTRIISFFYLLFIYRHHGLQECTSPCVSFTTCHPQYGEFSGVFDSSAAALVENQAYARMISIRHVHTSTAHATIPSFQVCATSARQRNGSLHIREPNCYVPRLCDVSHPWKRRVLQLTHDMH